MATNHTGRRNSNTQLLQELEQLNESLNQSHMSTKTRRTASLALPQIAIPPTPSADKASYKDDQVNLNRIMRARRVSLSMLLYRTRLEESDQGRNGKSSASNWSDDEPVSTSEENKGLWKWKPIRALTHITMQKLSCLFSVEVVNVQNLPLSMNGVRLSVCVRKKESREGTVQTMPSRVFQGAADFEETLFINCHVYYSKNHMKFEPRPFVIYVVAVDAEELDFGRSSVDLSRLIKESIEKSFEGARVRHWETAFQLSGKANGGEVVLKLGFQIMEKDGGVGIYSQSEGKKWKSRNSVSFRRSRSTTSFSVPSQAEEWTPLQKADDDGDLDLEKGVEILDKDKQDKEEERPDIRLVSSEVTKEVLQDKTHVAKLPEFDSLAEQIKVLEQMIGEVHANTVRKNILQMLEHANVDKPNNNNDEIHQVKLETGESEKVENSNVFLPDLGKRLSCVVQTKNGGYLAAMNPINTIVKKKDEPRLAMQISKPLILQPDETGFELFQKLAAVGLEELTSKISLLMPLDELKGKTAEQIAFEGIASAIIQGTAARTIATVKSLGNAMNSGRKERVLTGLWNVKEETLKIDEILAFSMQKIENMAMTALKIQANMAEENSPFNVPPLDAKTMSVNLLASAMSVEDLVNSNKTRIKNDDVMEASRITMCVVVQLRDPLRQYGAVGNPMVILIHALFDKSASYEDHRYKVESLQVGGIRSSDNKTAWDTEKRRLTALQWLVEYGVVKAGKKGKHVVLEGKDTLWSIFSRVMADMWLKPIRNPDIKFTE